MPPLTLENAAALVPGGVTADDIKKENRLMGQQKPAQPATLKVRVLRAFTNHERKVVEKDSEVTLPRIFALEMIAANKAELVKEPAAPAAAAPAPEKPKDAPGPKGERK